MLHLPWMHSIGTSALLRVVKDLMRDAMRWIDDMWDLPHSFPSHSFPFSNSPRRYDCIPFTELSKCAWWVRSQGMSFWSPHQAQLKMSCFCHFSPVEAVNPTMAWSCGNRNSTYEKTRKPNRNAWTALRSFLINNLQTHQSLLIVSMTCMPM